MNTEQFIDFRNIKLWNRLNEKFDIKIEETSNKEYSCYTINKEAIIYVDGKNISIDSFTHELLHIYLKDKQFHLGSAIEIILRKSRTLSRIISSELQDRIANCLDHIKMYAIYIELGFLNEQFLHDYNEFKCTEVELLDLKRNYKIGKKINTLAVDLYIGKLIAILCDPNESHDYTKIIPVFQKLDHKLYYTVNQLIEETKNYDLENNDTLISYRDISETFYHNLVSWLKMNKV